MFVLSARNSRKPSSSSTANAWIQQNRKARAITDRNRWYQNEHEIDCNALRLHDFLGVTEKKNLCNEAMRLVEEAVEKEERMAAEYQRKLVMVLLIVYIQLISQHLSFEGSKQKNRRASLSSASNYYRTKLKPM